MRSKQACSDYASTLIRLFVERSGILTPASPEQVICGLVDMHRPKRARAQAQRLDNYLQQRNIATIEIIANLHCDGVIEPLGSTYEEGFRMRLKKGASETRMRFTMAHEICHTFFYELVPELKFKLHDTDVSEERLCNVGAAAMLVDERSVRRRAKEMPISLDSLDQLAHVFGVSESTMLLRLRALRIWNCELSHWHRTVGGVFVLDRLHGGRKVNWAWENESILHRVWTSKRMEFGRDFVFYKERDGARRYKPISYHLRPTSSGVIALWGDGLRSPRSTMPLFQANSACNRKGTANAS
jgi:hypothetical protein